MVNRATATHSFPSSFIYASFRAKNRRALLIQFNISRNARAREITSNYFLDDPSENGRRGARKQSRYFMLYISKH